MWRYEYILMPYDNNTYLHVYLLIEFSAQLTQKSDQLQLLQHTLDEKRTELHKAEAKLRETEEKYYSSAANINDKVKDDLRVSRLQ